MRAFPSKARTATCGPDVSTSTEARAAGSAILAERESGGAKKAWLGIHGAPASVACATGSSPYAARSGTISTGTAILKFDSDPLGSHLFGQRFSSFAER